MQKQSHKHKSSRRDRPPRSANDTTETAWSLSQWHPEHNQFYRSRYKGSGEVEYEWLGSELPPTTESAPRTNINVDSLAQGMTNLDVNQNVGYGQDPSGGYADPHTAAEVSADLGLSTSPRYTHSIPQDHHTKPHARKGNGKEFAYEGTTVPSRKGKEVANEEPIAASRKGKGRSSHYDDQAGLQPAFSAAGHTSQSQYSGYQVEEDTDANYEREIERAQRESLRTVDSYGHEGSSSYAKPSTYGALSSYSSSTPYGTSYQQADASTYGLPSSYASSTSYGQSGYPQHGPTTYSHDHTETTAAEPAGGAPTPRVHSPVLLTTDHIVGTEGDHEHLDPRYKVEFSYKFQPGEVFKILWAEPTGTNTTSVFDEPLSDIQTAPGQQGPRGKFFIGFRRFIVVATDEGHSTCVPILTYERRGCNKKGVKANKHGIICSVGHRPKLLKGEPNMGYPPVLMKMSAEGEKLAKESRVNYSKLVTIEHNVKVFFIGTIEGRDFETVQSAVDECWQRKLHHTSRRTRN